MKVVRAVPTESLSEQLSVQRLSAPLGLHQMRANVFTLAEGSMSRHMHREQEEVYLVLAQHEGQTPFKPQIKKHRVPGLRMNHHRLHVRRKYKGRIIRPIEEENELMFRMRVNDPFQCLISEPTYSLELPF